MTNLDNFPEIWKDVINPIGYLGLYQVSSLGRIRSVPRKVNKNVVLGKILKPRVTNSGYSSICMKSGEIKKGFLVHRLVALAFIDNPENKRCVNHKNSIRTDNRLENLEWVTHSENTRYGIEKFDSFSHQRKLTKEQVFNILSISTGYGKIKEYAAKSNISFAVIQKIRFGSNYKKWYQEYKNINK